MPDAVSPIMRIADRVPLLTPAEEIILGRHVQAMLNLPDPPHTIQQQRIIKRGQRAKDRMVSANIKLVVSAAKKYRGMENKGGFCLDMEDLIQEGILGLIRAAEKYDPERGYKFSTYSYWWIRQFMFRSITQKGRMIKVPHQIAETMYRNSHKLATLEQTLGRTPTLAEAAAEFKMKPLDFEHAMMMCNERPRSLESTLIEDGSPMIEIIGSGSADDDLEAAGMTMEIDNMLNKLQTLTDLQREALERYYGLNGRQPLTMTEMSQQDGVSRQAIQFRVLKAERALRFRMAVGQAV